jgi:hypothetical protein
MRLFATLPPMAVATSVLASQAPDQAAGTLATRTSDNSSAFTATPISGCLQPWQATNIVNGYLYLLANPTATNFNTTADALLPSNYTETSDSYNQLSSLPVRPLPLFLFIPLYYLVCPFF